MPLFARSNCGQFCASICVDVILWTIWTRVRTKVETPQAPPGRLSFYVLGVYSNQMPGLLCGSDADDDGNNKPRTGCFGEGFLLEARWIVVAWSVVVKRHTRQANGKLANCYDRALWFGIFFFVLVFAIYWPQKQDQQPQHTHTHTFFLLTSKHPEHKINVA